jgi:HlyD family secretion protein
MAARADVAIARQKRDKALYDVKDTERILGSLQIKAPNDGLVSLLPNFRAGGPGRAAPEFRRGDRAWFGAPIAELPDLTQVQMTARVDEADRGRVQAGGSVRVRVDAVPDKELTGSLKDISVVAKPDFTTWPPVRNFDMVISLSDSDARLRSGMSASARVELDRLADVLVVPTGAVFQKGTTTVVYVVKGDAIESRPVNVLRRGRDQIALASGVGEGDRITLKEPEQEGAVR